jgi:CRP-like cAMP-binding protein
MSDALLSVIRQYIPLSHRDVEVVLSLFKRKSIGKGVMLLKEEEICRHLYFIETGLLRYFMNDDGRDITHFFAAENDFACNYESLLKQSPSRKNVQAIEETTVWTISQSDLDLFYKQIEQGERFGRLLMEKELLNTISRFLEHYTHSPEQRYQDFLSQFSALHQRIPQYYIASYVGVQPPSLSRIRKRMASLS